MEGSDTVILLDLVFNLRFRDRDLTPLWFVDLVKYLFRMSNRLVCGL